MYINKANEPYPTFPFLQAHVSLCTQLHMLGCPHFLGSNFLASPQADTTLQKLLSFLDSPVWFKHLLSMGCVCISIAALDLIYSNYVEQ